MYIKCKTTVGEVNCLDPLDPDWTKMQQPAALAPNLVSLTTGLGTWYSWKLGKFDFFLVYKDRTFTLSGTSFRSIFQLSQESHHVLQRYQIQPRQRHP